MAVDPDARIAYACLGWPEGHRCPVRIAEGIWCQECRTKRQYALSRGIPDAYRAAETAPVDIEAEVLVCACGGDANADDHEHTLLHVEWSWKHEGSRPDVPTH